ncbi:MAG: hypothetical protein MUO97_02275 [Dehalococcoidia bacterium]|nr:hypothetical protein [Dehalococcoidia bacterium]
MNDQNLQELWEQKYKIYKEVNAKYDETLGKYFPRGTIEPGGRIEWERKTNVPDDKAREEIKEVLRARKEASDNLEKVERKMDAEYLT